MRLLALTLLAVAAAGCGHVTARSRTLPERIQSLYIEMPQNDSTEYGFQEDLARRLHEEFLADGRLQPVRRPLADAWLETRILNFSRTPRAFNDDDFPLVDQAEIEAEVTLWEPNQIRPTLRTRAIGNVGFLSDPRRSQFEPEAEWRDALLESLALRIVDAVLTYTPEDDEARRRFESPGISSEQDVELERDFPQAVPSVGGVGRY